DIVCVTSQIKTGVRDVRSLIELDEIIEVKPEIGKVNANKLFVWDPITDKITMRGKSIVFKKIIERTSLTEKKLMEEFRRRTLLLEKMAKANITDFRKVNEILNTYIKNRESLPPQLKV
ncbi:MAG: hypothetical protein N3D84_01885, partial [Candidatus Woesearchaeota archaeon]|nr:hypothetical protein [Candidatus Woesearchaeota archaeon]